MLEREKVKEFIRETSIRLGSVINNNIGVLKHDDMVKLAMVGIMDEIYVDSGAKAAILYEIAGEYEQEEKKMVETKDTEESQRKERIIEMTFALKKMIEENLVKNGRDLGYYIEGNSEIIQRYEALDMFISGIMEGLSISDEEKLNVLLRAVAEYIKSLEY